jgi:hypothetical protein
MTALNLIVQRDAAHLITDGAFYSDDGVPLFFASKAWSYGHVKAAFGISGRVDALFAQDLVNASPIASQAELKRFMADFARLVTARNDELHPESAGQPANGLRLAGVAWNEEKGWPEGWAIGTYGHGVGSAKDGVLYVGGAGWVQPQFPGEAAFLDRWADLDPVEDGRAILTAQRSWAHGPDRPAGPALSVGGFGELISVSKDGVTVSRIIDWPDRVGELPQIAA